MNCWFDKNLDQQFINIDKELPKMKLRSKYRFMIVNLTLFLFQIVGCGTLSNENILPVPDVAPATRTILEGGWFDAVSFGFTGLAFFNGHLYASSDRGLLEFSDGKLSRIYQWSNVNDILEEIAFDSANNLLWFRHAKLNKFINYNGTNWSFAPLPIDEKSLSRGDLLRGFQPFSTDEAFFLQGTEESWQWNTKENKWQRLSMPKQNCYVASSSVLDIRCFVGVAPTNNDLFVIMRRSDVLYVDGIMSRAEPTETDSDIVFFKQDNQWNEIPNNSGINFFTKKIINGQNSAFILTYRNQLIRVTKNEISLIEPLGKVEAMTTTTKGTLLVSIENNGVYEYDSRWHKLFDSPYPSDIGEHFSYLTERDGKVAFAINYSSKTKQLPCNIDNSASLWIFDKDSLTCAFKD